MTDWLPLIAIVVIALVAIWRDGLLPPWMGALANNDESVDGQIATFATEFELKTRLQQRLQT